ncbi:MAG: hypothetical protein FWC53_00100 [Firmicutes bacterium]|nr:hypothetical protein [Bacillota bacterium]
MDGLSGYAKNQWIPYSYYNQWTNSNTVADATAAFQNGFERPLDRTGSLAERTRRAQKYYDEFHGRTMGSGSFLEVAKKCHDYLRENNYYYSSYANVSACRYIDDGRSAGSHIPKPNNTDGGTYIDCSAYVTWVLFEYGYRELGGWQKTTTWLMNPNVARGYRMDS